MPNIRSQSITANGIDIVGSDGREYHVTKEEVIAHFQSLNGPVPVRRAATIQWVVDSIVAAIGPENISASDIGIDADMTVGELRKLQLGSAEFLE